MTQDGLTHDQQIVIPCSDLAEALEFFVERLGYRIEMIMPADAPRIAVISGHGVTLRLETKGAETEPKTAQAKRDFIISRLNEGDGWHSGRAGMQYRDLIPGRFGGRVVASHIRIPVGGQVPDYVHYHKVGFQMIYCKSGWVRVVYEDQGPPFTLQAGDCVLQPPQIRHRVLEASPGLEVIEITSPAVHETYADHNLKLPTSQLSPERLFDGQRFVRDIATEALWTPWRDGGFEARDTGIASATNGLASVHVVKSVMKPAQIITKHEGEFLFLFVLKGELELNDAHQLRAGDSCVVPSGIEYQLHASEGVEFLEASIIYSRPPLPL